MASGEMLEIIWVGLSRLRQQTGHLEWRKI